MKWLLNLFGVPPEKILDISIPKEKIMSNVDAAFLQKEASLDALYVDEIIYRAIFRAPKKLKKAQELHIIEVKLSQPKYVKKMAQAMQQAIPYSLVVVFSSKERYLLFTSEPKFKKVHSFQFSAWVYKEELLIDFALGTRRERLKNIVEDQVDDWSEVSIRLQNMFDEAYRTDYCSVRRIAETLRIKEKIDDKELVETILSRLIEDGYIEYFDDIPFVIRSHTEDEYAALFPYKFYGDCSIEDQRYGIDRQFERLAEDEFLTFQATHELLNRLELFGLVRGRNVPKSYYADDDEY